MSLAAGFERKEVSKGLVGCREVYGGTAEKVRGLPWGGLNLLFL